MSKDAATKKDELNNGNLLERARALFGQEDFAGSYLLSKEHWLSFPDDLGAVQLLCEIIRLDGKCDELYRPLKVLAQSQDDLLNNVQSMFEAGYRFIDAREPELAAMLLGRCAKLNPRHAVIHYELGFALMQLRRFQEAIAEFEDLLQHDDDFDTRLNLTVCHSLMRNLNRSRQLVLELEKYAGSEEEKKELQLRKWVIRRLEHFENKHSLDVRDWVFSLYGSVLLNDSTVQDLTSKHSREICYPDIAGTLVLLSRFIELSEAGFEVIEYYSPLSRPLAEALARFTKLTAEPYRGPDRRQSALLVMAWATNIIGPHKVFVQHKAGRAIFAYGLTVDSQLPVTPEIIGSLSCECAMPWAKDLDELDSLGACSGKKHPMNDIQEKATSEILACMSNTAADEQLARRIEELQSYYQLKKDLLVLNNVESFPERPEYTAEIPF